MLNFESPMTQNCRGPRRSSARARKACAGITLTEIVISLAITTLAVGGMVSGYTFSVERAEWSTRSAAAQILADQKLEQTKAARWDPMASPPIDELVSTNFLIEVTALAIPSTSAQGILATNITTISLVSSDPPLKMIRIESIWPFKRGPVTNTIVTYRSPDQ
jgi:Tfp pilus assembly protein PilV